MDFDLNEMLIDVMSKLGEDHQDMLMVLFQRGIIAPSDTIEGALTKIDMSDDEYSAGIMDDVMHGITGSASNGMSEITVVTRDEPAAHGTLDTFGFFQPEEVNRAPDMMGITLQELMDSADEEDAVELDWLVAKHFMKPSSDVTELVIKLNTLLNPQMGGMPGGVEDITATQIDFNDMANTPVGNLMPHQVHEHNKQMRSAYGLKLIEKILGRRENPEQQKFIEFLGGLKGNHDDELISIVENGFKLIHKQNKSS